MKAADKPIARELITALLKNAKDSTFRATFERLKPAPDGRIRSVFSPCGTETGRMSSSESFLDPSTNLQNLSVKWGKIDALYNVKDVVVAPPGRALIEADLSQAEARVAAWMAEDPLAIQQYEQGVDRYRFLAAAAFHGAPDRGADVTKAQRDAGKMGLLAFQYGVSWKTYMEQTNSLADLTGVTVSASVAKRIEGVFHELWPCYRVWWDQLLSTVLSTGALVNPFGRKRIFFGRADTESHRDKLRKECVAFMPQSTVADHMNARIRAVYDALDPHTVWVHAQIHDALLASAPFARRLHAARTIKALLEHPLEINGRTLVIPADVKLSTSSWADAKELAA